MIPSGLPSHRLQKEERGQTPSLYIKRKHEAWRVQGLVYGFTSGQGKGPQEGSHLLCLDCISKMLEHKHLTVSLHFSYLCLFSLNHKGISRLGNPSQSPPAPCSPEQIAPKSCRNSHCPHAPIWLQALLGGRHHVGCGDVFLAISIGGLVPGIGLDGQGISTQA